MGVLHNQIIVKLVLFLCDAGPTFMIRSNSILTPNPNSDIINESPRFAKRFGADFTLNPKEVDVVKEVHGILAGEADVAIEASGASIIIYLAREPARAGGKLVIFGKHVKDEKVPTEKWH